MTERDQLLAIGGRLNKIRDRFYLDIFAVINELQLIASTLPRKVTKKGKKQ